MAESDVEPSICAGRPYPSLTALQAFLGQHSASNSLSQVEATTTLDTEPSEDARLWRGDSEHYHSHEVNHLDTGDGVRPDQPVAPTGWGNEGLYSIKGDEHDEPKQRPVPMHRQWYDLTGDEQRQHMIDHHGRSAYAKNPKHVGWDGPHYDDHTYGGHDLDHTHPEGGFGEPWHGYAAPDTSQPYPFDPIHSSFRSEAARCYNCGDVVHPTSQGWARYDGEHGCPDGSAHRPDPAHNDGVSFTKPNERGQRDWGLLEDSLPSSLNSRMRSESTTLDTEPSTHARSWDGEANEWADHEINHLDTSDGIRPEHLVTPTGYNEGLYQVRGETPVHHDTDLPGHPGWYSMTEAEQHRHLVVHHGHDPDRLRDHLPQQVDDVHLRAHSPGAAVQHGATHHHEGGDYGQEWSHQAFGDYAEADPRDQGYVDTSQPYPLDWRHHSSIRSEAELDVYEPQRIRWQEERNERPDSAGSHGLYSVLSEDEPQHQVGETHPAWHEMTGQEQQQHLREHHGMSRGLIADYCQPSSLENVHHSQHLLRGPQHQHPVGGYGEPWSGGHAYVDTSEPYPFDPRRASLYGLYSAIYGHQDEQR